MKTALVIGGGFAGCTAAHQFALKGGWDVTLIEAAPFLGAGVRTQWYGGHPYTFGPRHFLTRNEAVFEFLNKYLPLRRCADHQFLTYVERDAQFYNFPIHRDDISKMPDRAKIDEELKMARGAAEAQNLEDYWIRSVGPTLYSKYIDAYSKKMWRVDDNRKIDTFNWSPKGVALKEGPRAAWDIAISAYPYDPAGYNPYFDIGTKEAKVLLSTRIEAYDIPQKRVKFGGEWRSYDVIVNTISPDMLFESVYGELPFIGRDFHKIVLPAKSVFPEHVYFLYYANDEQFTRIVEYKKFTHHESPTTLLGLEIPSLNGKHYPLPIKSEQARAQKYLDLLPEGVFSIGRAGTYRYDVDIDDCIEQAMKMIAALN
jgi:UDP-galactopyranose mutase